MKIVVGHNRYKQDGGEDIVCDVEMALLRKAGHNVIEYYRDNDEISTRGTLRHLAVACGAIWSRSSYCDFGRLLVRDKPDLVHFHNTFPLISPSVYFACANAGVPVVQTLHNYRLLCPSASFFRDGRPCESCLGKMLAWPGVLHACYRESRPATAAAAAMLVVHRAVHTWRDKVDIYIALSEFARNKFVEGGLPPEKIIVKPNFVAEGASKKPRPGDYALFVGRLSEEKGPQLLMEAWCGKRLPLRVVGDGPLLDSLRQEVGDGAWRQVELMGRRSREEVHSLMLGARFLVAPSICYENFPMAIVEAFASGLPVIASRIGSLAEIVQDGVTGLHFELGNAADLAAKVQWAWDHPEEMSRMGRNARAEFETKYTAERNYRMLMQIYEKALSPPV